MDTQEIDKLRKDLEDLKKKVDLLSQKRITQQMVVPDAIKMRAMGEANRFVRAGVTADKPTIGETSTDSIAMYYDTTTNKLYVYNGAWKSVTLS